MKNKKAVVLILGIIGLGLSGCVKDYTDNYRTSIEQVSSRNIEVIQKMYDVGLINKAQKETHEESIKDIVKSYVELKDSAVGGALEKSVVWVNTEGTNKNTKKIDDEIDSMGDKAEPICVFDDSIADYWDELINCKVKVLKGGSKGEDLATLISLVESAEKNLADGKAIKNTAKLNKYFEDSGVTLFDTVESLATTSGTTGGNKSSELESYKNGLGKDLLLVGKGAPAYSVRIKEFNPSILELLEKLGASASNKYMIDTATKSVYLLEYSVDIINSVSVTSGNYLFSSDKSKELFINLGEKAMYTVKDDGKVKKLKAVDKTVNMYTFGKVKSGKIEEESSFIMGYDNTSCKIKDTSVYDCREIILRDYLELTYAPDIVATETMIALGRKIRIASIGGESTTVAAKFIGSDGLDLEGTPGIFITDFIGSKSGNVELNKANKNLKYKLAISNPNNTTSGSSTEDTDGLVKDVGSLTITKWKSSIKTTLKFPSVNESGKANLAGVDVPAAPNNSRVFGYGMALDMNAFSSLLYSGWIDTNDNTKGSLSWWNNWLSTNNYLYTIDKNKISEFFCKAYAVSFTKENGTIILDVDTLIKIQGEIDEDARVGKVTKFRTMFIGLALIIIAYAFILMGAWVVDTSIVNGPGIVKIMTIGKYEAVKEDLELPDVEHGTSYLDFKAIFMRALFIIALGIVLMTVDIIDLMMWVFGIVKLIGDAIRGILYNS